LKKNKGVMADGKKIGCEEVRDPAGRLVSMSQWEEQEVDDEEFTVHQLMRDNDALARAREAVRRAYAEVEERDRNAWRKGKGPRV
jgi:hypothetical protein